MNMLAIWKLANLELRILGLHPDPSPQHLRANTHVFHLPGPLRSGFIIYIYIYFVYKCIINILSRSHKNQVS